MNRPANTPLNLLAAALSATLSLALVACSNAPETPAAAAPEEPPLAGATIGGEFELTDKNGETVRWSDFDGQYRIVYFGFTYCPDICPTDVQRMTQGLRQFAEAAPDRAAQIRPIFITIDPERDTPEIVGEFANAFSEDLIGLTGTPEQIKAAADTFRIFYAKGEVTETGGYLMDHSNITYLFGPDGEPIATLPTDQGADAVTAELDKWVS